MDFEHAPAVLRNGGTDAEVGDALEIFFADVDAHGVNAVRGQLQSRGVDIGSGKAQLLAHHLSADHLAEDGVGTAESLFSERQVAAGHREADGRAGNHFTIDRHRRNSVHLEPAEALKQLDIAAATFAEFPIRANHDAAERLAGGAQIRDEFLRRLTRAPRLEGQHGQMRDALTLEQQLFVTRIRQTQGRLGALEKHHGMRFEGHDHGGATGFPRIGLCFLDQSLVPPVHAVENPDGEIDRSAQRGQRREVVDHLHGNQTPRRRETSGRLMIRALIASNGSVRNSSTVRTPSTRNFPDAVRRRAFKCPPQPSNWPMSCA